MLQTILNFDVSALLWIQENIRCEFLNWIMIFFTSIGNVGLIWIVMGICMVCTKKFRYAGVTMLFCLAFAWLITEPVIKNIVQRPRPFEEIEALTVLVAKPTSYSFPSGHSCSSFACAYALTRTYGKRGAWFYIPAALIALSRLYVGVHYPTDVLTGAIAGTVLAIPAFWIRSRYIHFPKQ